MSKPMCLNLHTYSYLKVSGHLLAADPLACGFPARIVPYLPALCGCLGYLLILVPWVPALPLSFGEVSFDKNNPVFEFPPIISCLRLVQPALNPDKGCGYQLSQVLLVACFPISTQWCSSPFPGGADAHECWGWWEGWEKPEQDEWAQCVALLQVSQQCCPFCWWPGREIRYRSFVSHELSSHFWTASATWLYMRENMGEDCCFVEVFFLGVEMCSVCSCLTLWDFLQSWLDALARKAWQAPNQAGPAEYYKQ